MYQPPWVASRMMSGRGDTARLARPPLSRFCESSVVGFVCVIRIYIINITLGGGRLVLTREFEEF